MKTPLNVDWELAKHLYLKGVQPHVIAQQLQINVDTLKKHGQRHQWTALKAKVSEHLSLNEPTNAPTKSVSIEERSKAVREGLALDLHGTVEMLPKIARSTKAARLRERQAVVDQVATTGERVFGWNQASDKEMLVNVVSLSTAEFIPGKPGTPVIDVGPEPTEDYTI